MIKLYIIYEEETSIKAQRPLSWWPPFHIEYKHVVLNFGDINDKDNSIYATIKVFFKIIDVDYNTISGDLLFKKILSCWHRGRSLLEKNTTPSH